MKLKQEKAVKAYLALRDLKKVEWPGTKARAAFDMEMELQKSFDFQLEREQAFFDKFCEAPDAEGNRKFKSPEASRDFQECMKDLADMEIEADVKPFSIRLTDDMKISIENIRRLQGLIDME